MKHQSASSGRAYLSEQVSGGHVPDDERIGRRDDILAARHDGDTERCKPMSFKRVLERTTGRVEVVITRYQCVDL